MSISLIGNGSHAHDLSVILDRLGVHNITAYDDDATRGIPLSECKRGPILLGSNYPEQRKQMAERFSHLRGCAPVIDPSAIIGPEVHCGLGSVVAPFVTMLRDVRLGEHAHINFHASMTRCTIGAFSTVSPSATICGDVTVGVGVLVGAGATICDRSTIGDGVIIGAGALVPPCSIVPDGAKVIGVYKT